MRTGNSSWWECRWDCIATQQLKRMRAIIFTVNNIILYPRAIPEHDSTHSRLVTDFLQCVEKK